MSTSRFDLRTFIIIFGAALFGAAWALYNRSITSYPYSEAELRPLVWVIFATPFATFWGWFFARPAERWWALFVCFCFYFFSTFVSGRYELCTVVRGSFDLGDCFTAMTQAQQAAASNGHKLYFQTIVVVHILVALVIALQRAMNRSTISTQLPIPEGDLA